MTAAPRTTQPQMYQGGHPPRTSPHSDTERFLSFIYRGQEGGYFEVCYIKGDPNQRRNPDGTPNPDSNAARHSWHRYDTHALPIVAELITMLAEQYGDVYVSRTCYPRRKRDAAAAMPSRALVVDDAPAEGDYTFTIKTSKRKQHGWCILDRALDATAMEELSQRAAYALGGDKGGWDVTQLVRVPGTYNTKGGERWAVQYQANSRRTYTADELRQRYPALTQHRMGKRGDLATDTDVENFYRGNHRTLLGADGVPRRLSANSPARRIQQGGIPEDRSQARWDYILSCVLHRLTNEEIIVHAETFCDWGESDDKPKGWLDEDIRDCLRKLRRDLPDIKPSSPYLFCSDEHIGPPVARVIKEPARRGRPAGVTADAYHAELHKLAQVGGDGDEVIVLMTVGEVAAHLHICRRKAATLEAQLRAAGRIGERRRANKNHSSYLVLTPDHAVLRHAKNTADAQNASVDDMQKIGEPESAQTPVYSIPTPQSEESPTAQGEHTPVAAQPVAPAPVGQAGGVSPLPASAPSLAEMVAEALDAQPGLHRRHMPTKVQQVAAYIEANYERVVRPQALERLIVQTQRRQAWDRDRAKLAELATDDLYAQQRKRERRHVRASMEGSTKQVYAIGWQLQHVNDELTRRGLPLEAPRMKRRKKADPKPAATPAMQRYIELAISEPEPVAIATPPPPSYDVAGMVQRLRARKTQEAITP